MPETKNASAGTTEEVAEAEKVAAAEKVEEAAKTTPATDTPDSLNEAAMSAIQAWHGDTSDDALKDAARVAIEKSKEASKTAKATATAEAKKTEEATVANKPPETYEIKLADGSLLNPEQVEEIKVFAKANNLSNEKAQAFADHQNSVMANFVAYNKPGGKGWEKQLDTWETESLADPEIGGGNKETLAKNAELSKRVVAKFGDEDMSNFLHETGFGSNKTVLRFLGKVAKAMGDDILVTPGTGAIAPKSMEETFYGKSES